MRFLAALLFGLVLAGSAVAMEPGEALPDAAQEQHARALFHEFRCMVCQNQSIAESDAPLARDLRMLVRERVAAGESDAAITRFLVARYGEFVLLKPPFEPRTLLLWLTPVGVLVLGGAAALLARRRRQAAPQPSPLSTDEEARLRDLLGPETVD
jgi:cytochrome c-type biogenesis protein CcmH